MSLFLRVILVITILFAYVGNSHAGLIEHKTYDNNDKGLVVIADTGYEWLNLSFTADMSFDDAVFSYQSMGFFSPDISMVTSMLSAIGIKASNDGSTNNNSCALLVDPTLCSHSEDEPEGYSFPFFTWFDVTNYEGENRKETLAFYDPTGIDLIDSAKPIDGSAPFLWADQDPREQMSKDDDVRIFSGYKNTGFVSSMHISTFLVRDIGWKKETSLASITEPSAIPIPEPSTVTILLLLAASLLIKRSKPNSSKLLMQQ